MAGRNGQHESRGEWDSSPGRSETFGRLLRTHRLAAGLSQAELAERAGLGERAIQRLERDRNRPYRATVQQLTAALRLSADQRARLEAAVPPRSPASTKPVAGSDAPAIARLRLVRDTRASGRSAGSNAIEPLHPSRERSGSEPADLPAPTSDRRTIQRPRGRLIGRDAAAEAVQTLLLRPEVGLVTLTGPGGSGKTRLAVQVAADLADRFEHGAVLVNLALIGDPAAVPAAIVQALDLMDQGDQPPDERLRHHLRDRHLLLVLDNFEHVVAARTVVADLLDACPRLVVLVTSRAALHIYAECEVPVAPLVSPMEGEALTLDEAASYPAVELFVERAWEVRPDFALTAENVGAVVGICRRLDGLPLAIELAAARSRLLSPRAMLGRLERRLPLLTDGPQNRPARLQTLRGAIAWSYDLLDEDERRMFRRLAVCVGGWTLDAAERLGGPGSEARGMSAAVDLGDSARDALDLVGSLLDKSLVVTLPEIDGLPRFGMLETIREFALEQLEDSGEAAYLRQRHAEYYLLLAEQAGPHLITDEQLTWLARVDAEHANIRAALAWLTGQDGEASARDALRLAGALRWYWWLGGAVAEGRSWLRVALARVRADDPLVVPARARALYAAGGLATVQGEYPLAAALLDESAELFRRLDDRQGLGRAMAYLGILAILVGDHERAGARLLASLQILREVDDPWGLALAGSNLAALNRNLGDIDEADRLLDEYVALARQTGDRYLLGSILPKWAWVAHARGDLERAEDLGREALGLFRALNDGWWTARCLHLLTYLAVARGDDLRASRLLGASEHLLQIAGARLVPTDAAESGRLAEAMRAHLGDAPFDRGRAEGRSATLVQIVQYAMDKDAVDLPPPPACLGEGPVGGAS